MEDVTECTVMGDDVPALTFRECQDPGAGRRLMLVRETKGMTKLVQNDRLLLVLHI